jgi:1-acyl-sn-glycerol-3-phosphate acyltransferase
VPITAIRSLTGLLYGVYAWLILSIVMIPVAVGLLVTPGVMRRRRLAHQAARAVLLAIGSRLRVEGATPGPNVPCVVVANHSSYLDGIILTAALPPRFTFLIKHEMTKVPVAAFVLRRLGSHFVDRDSVQQRHRTAKRLVTAVANGGALAVFPEGTFDRPPGLRRFQMGAFIAAWRARTAVVPVVIEGARRMLPSETLLPRPGKLTVKICAPLATQTYPDAAALMAATRRAILEHLDEPDLAVEAGSAVVTGAPL